MLHRVPFFLEPGYLSKPESFREPHIERMIRKFGDRNTFEQFKKRHGLVPRANEVGIPWTEELLSARVQSATLRSHRLVLWVAATVKARHLQIIQEQQSFPTISIDKLPDAAFVAAEAEATEAVEALYASLNRRHFEEGGALNDLSLLLSAVDEAVCPRFGITRLDAEVFLAGSETQKTVLRTVERVHDELGVNSIPTLIVDGGRFLLSGVASNESVQDILMALRRVSELGPIGKKMFNHPTS